MAVVNLKSQYLTNRDAVPRVLTDGAAGAGAVVKRKAATVTITSGDNINSTYRLFDLPSNAVIVSLEVSAPDIGTTTAADLGLYDTPANGGAVVDADFFRAALVLNAGAISKSECAFSNVISLTNSLKRIWDLLTLTRDPVKTYDVAFTLTGTADGTGLVLAEVLYTE